MPHFQRSRSISFDRTGGGGATESWTPPFIFMTADIVVRRLLAAPGPFADSGQNRRCPTARDSTRASRDCLLEIDLACIQSNESDLFPRDFNLSRFPFVSARGRFLTRYRARHPFHLY